MVLVVGFIVGLVLYVIFLIGWGLKTEFSINKE